MLQAFHVINYNHSSIRVWGFILVLWNSQNIQSKFTHLFVPAWLCWLFQQQYYLPWCKIYYFVVFTFAMHFSSAGLCYSKQHFKWFILVCIHCIIALASWSKYFWLPDCNCRPALGWVLILLIANSHQRCSLIHPSGATQEGYCFNFPCCVALLFYYLMTYMSMTDICQISASELST